jgi:hypothetical protein
MAGTITAAPSASAHQRVEVPIGKSAIYTSTRGDIGRVSVAKPEVANFVMLSARQVYITGVAAGATALTVWDRGDKLLDVYDVDVAPDVGRVKRMLHDIMPEETDLKVMASHDAITLSGSVKNSEHMKKALALAEIHVAKPEKVVNMVKVGGVHQVMLEVRVAEMSRDIANHMGINVNAISQGDFVYTLLGGLSSIDGTMMDNITPQNEYFYMQDDEGTTVFRRSRPRSRSSSPARSRPRPRSTPPPGFSATTPTTARPTTSPGPAWWTCSSRTAWPRSWPNPPWCVSTGRRPISTPAARSPTSSPMPSTRESNGRNTA